VRTTGQIGGLVCDPQRESLQALFQPQMDCTMEYSVQKGADLFISRTPWYKCFHFSKLRKPLQAIVAYGLVRFLRIHNKKMRRL